MRRLDSFCVRVEKETLVARLYHHTITCAVNLQQRYGWFPLSFGSFKTWYACAWLVWW
jgi:hypothetical protein